MLVAMGIQSAGQYKNSSSLEFFNSGYAYVVKCDTVCGLWAVHRNPQAIEGIIGAGVEFDSFGCKNPIAGHISAGIVNQSGNRIILAVNWCAGAVKFD